MTDAELNRTVCTAFLECPLSPAEPWEADQALRDGHFYVQFYLDSWHQRTRQEWGPGFIPLPWYRQKAVCQRVAQRVRAGLRESWPDIPEEYTREHVAQVWNCIKRGIALEAPKEYDSFYGLVLERSDC